MTYLDVRDVYGQRNVTLYTYDIGEDGTVTRTTPDEGPGTLPILGLEARSWRRAPPDGNATRDSLGHSAWGDTNRGTQACAAGS